MTKSLILKVIILIMLVGAVYGLFFFLGQSNKIVDTPLTDLPDIQNGSDTDSLQQGEDPLSIKLLRETSTPGSDLQLVESLPDGSNYRRSIVSYESEGNTIYALLTVPYGDRPSEGWPVIVFNHGYIPPAQYRTTERYLAYTDAFSRNGYILIRPDYRGHGNSEGTATGGYGSNAYTIDVLNAVSSVKKHKDADPEKIGMWGHSMGGFITLRSMVVRDDIKAGVIWAGVVASYPDLLNNWRRRNQVSPPSGIPSSSGRGWRQQLVNKYGEPAENPAFWDSISANAYLRDISGPIQIHHGTADSSVPVAFSQTLHSQMEKAGKESEIFIYEGDDHNISLNLSSALDRSVQFFDAHLKGVVN